MSEIEMDSGVRVKCLDDSNCQTIKKGCFYTVRSVAGDVVFLREKGDIGYAKKRFEATAEAEPVKETDFGKGDVYLIDAVAAGARSAKTLVTNMPNLNIGDLVVARASGAIQANTSHGMEIYEVVNILPIDDGFNQDNANIWVVDRIDTSAHEARVERLARKRELSLKRQQLEVKAEQLIQEEMRRKTLQDILGNSEAGKALLDELNSLDREIGQL